MTCLERINLTLIYLENNLILNLHIYKNKYLMGESIDKVLYASIIAYIIVMIIILVIKPNFIYDDEHKTFKSFGFSENQTITALPIFSVVLCILIYLILIIYTLAIKKLK